MNKRAQLYKYKGNCCSSCGKSVQEVLDRFGTFDRVFELHHIDPKKKADNYKNLIKQKLSAKQLDEVDKCVLLCSFCHKILHAQNILVSVNISINYDGRIISQDLNGWLIVDQQEHSTKFFSEEKVLIIPYLEQVNDGELSVVFGTELESGTHYRHSVSKLRIGESYRIYKAESNELMLQAVMTEKGLELDINIKFGFIEIDASKAAKGTRFWYRNGFRLLENGDVQTEGMFKFAP